MRGELLVAPSQVVDPHRRIDQHYEVFRERRRRIERSPFSVPPKAANLRALSSATRASSPAWTIAVFSLIPLRRLALASSSSSMFSVVLICMSMHDLCIAVKTAGDPPLAGR